MTSEFSRRRLRIIPLDDEQRAHDELEKACNDVNGGTKRVHDWTIYLVERIYDKYIKEGKDRDEDLRKICREIWKMHPQHKRQIQRVFDWKDPNSPTGERPYRRFKGKYGEEDESELHITAKSAEVGGAKSRLLNKLRDEQKVTYDTFQSEDAELFSNEIKEHQELIPLAGLSNDDLKKLQYKYQDVSSTLEKELNGRGLRGTIPSNVGISYGGQESKDDSTILSNLPSDKREPIHLRPADIPKSEQIRSLQVMEGKLMYAMSRGYKSRGDSLMKMNYISNDPKLNERIIVHYLQEMMILAFTSLQILNEFMKYFEKFKSKKKLTEEDKEIIRMLLHTLSHLEIRVKYIT